MALTYAITSASGGIGSSSYIDYTVRFYNDRILFYTYTRRSINYSGNYLPSSSTIYTEANTYKNSSSFICGGGNNHGSLLNTSINSSHRLSNYSTLVPNNNDILGTYKNSSSSSFDGLYYRRYHYYSHGYVLEKYLTTNVYIFAHYGQLETGAITDGSHVGTTNCYYLSITYTITLTKIQTTCCVLACCEPDKYELI